MSPERKNPESFADGRALARKSATTLVSVTRFRLRSLRFLPFFLFHSTRTIAQIRKSEGFVAGAVRRDADLAFWTLTVWRDAQAMRAYGASGAHRKAAPHLADWADEASMARWGQEGGELPEWPEAVRRLREEGRKIAVRYPAQDRPERSLSEPQMTYGIRL